MAKNELLPFADGEDANVLPTNQWEALTDILENGFQSGIARSEQVNRVLAQGAVASYVLGQLIVDQLNKDATLDKDTLYQNLVSALQENAKDACLPLGGGTLKGAITLNTATFVKRIVDDSYIQINGGSAWNSGASIELRGKGNETNAGVFYVRTADGTNTKNLVFKPDGTATWDNKTILTTANGLAINGSNKMDGNIGFTSSHHVYVDRADGYLRIWGGKVDDAGGNITIFGKDHATGWGSGGGGLQFEASNGTTIKALKLNANGSLTWDGNNVITSAGGTMTGALGRSGALANNVKDDSNLQINGGSGWGKGASIELYGKDRTTDGGAFKVRAHNGTTCKDFIAKPDGTLTWDSHSINHYLSGTGKRLTTDGTDQTIPFDGLLFIEAQRGGTELGSLTVYINGSNIETVRSNNYSYGYAQIPVKKGDIYKGVASNLSIATADVMAYK